MSIFDLDRHYSSDDSYPGRFKVYDHGEFVCSGLTLHQAQSFCKGADLVQMDIKELCF